MTSACVARGPAGQRPIYPITSGRGVWGESTYAEQPSPRARNPAACRTRARAPSAVGSPGQGGGAADPVPAGGRDRPGRGGQDAAGRRGDGRPSGRAAARVAELAAVAEPSQVPDQGATAAGRCTRPRACRCGRPGRSPGPAAAAPGPGQLEQVVDAVAEAGARSCSPPTISWILATSREPLGLPGEARTGAAADAARTSGPDCPGPGCAGPGGGGDAVRRAGPSAFNPDLALDGEAGGRGPAGAATGRDAARHRAGRRPSRGTGPRPDAGKAGRRAADQRQTGRAGRQRSLERRRRLELPAAEKTEQRVFRRLSVSPGRSAWTPPEPWRDGSPCSRSCNWSTARCWRCRGRPGRVAATRCCRPCAGRLREPEGGRGT